MDIYSQIILNSVVLLFGIMCLFPFGLNLNLLTLSGLSWFLGWSIIGFAETVLVVIGVNVSLIQIGLLSFCLLGAIWLNSGFRGLKGGTEKETFMRIAGILSLSMCIFIILANFANFMNYSTDSITNEGLSRIFHKYGAYADGESGLFDWLSNVRLPFYIAIHNTAYLCGIESFYTYLSATTIFGGLTMLGMWLDGKRKCEFCSIIAIMIVIGTYFSNRLIMFHSFYSLSNLTNMAYYTTGILALYRYRSDREEVWFLLACLFLGITGIIRKEMLVFSLLPFIFALKDLRPRRIILVMGLCIYLLCGHSWHVWNIVKGMSVVFEGGFKTKGHGGIWLQLLCIVTSPVVFMLPWEAIKKIGGIKVAAGLTALAVPVLIYYKDPLAAAGYKMYLLMFKGKGLWGYFWYFVAIGLCISIAGRMLSQFSWWGAQEVSADLLSYTVISFMIMRLLLYAVFDSPKADSWNDSGNRILLHIYPTSLFFLGEMIYCLCCASMRVREVFMYRRSSGHT